MTATTPSSTAQTAADAAHDEWEFETGVGSFGQDFDVSIPAQLRFQETPEQDTDAFHAALKDHGITSLDANPAQRANDSSRGPYYDGEVLIEDGYKRVKVVVMRGDTVRVYPREDTPTVDELAALIDALETGFNAPLNHEPIPEDE